MESRTYVIGGKDVKVTNKRILDIVKKAESLESLEKFHEAQQELHEYLLGEDCQNYLSLSQYMSNMSLWEAIAFQSFDSLTERYAIKFNLSGRFTPEQERIKLRALKRDSNENPGSVLKGLDETLKEPQ